LIAPLRKRTWKSGEEVNMAWVADYSDQAREGADLLLTNSRRIAGLTGDDI
jgi:hypothetical protein